MIESMAHEPRLPRGIIRPSSRIFAWWTIMLWNHHLQRGKKNLWQARIPYLSRCEAETWIKSFSKVASTNGMGNFYVGPDDPTSAIAFLLPGSCLFAGQPKQRLSSDSSQQTEAEKLAFRACRFWKKGKRESKLEIGDREKTRLDVYVMTPLTNRRWLVGGITTQTLVGFYSRFR